MIHLTRLNGEPMAINAEMLERAEETPDTVLTLSNGSHYVVAESLQEVVAAIRQYKASVLALAQEMLETPGGAVLELVPEDLPERGARAAEGDSAQAKAEPVWDRRPVARGSEEVGE